MASDNTAVYTICKLGHDSPCQDNSGYGYFYDIEDIPDTPTIYLPFLVNEESFHPEKRRMSFSGETSNSYAITSRCARPSHFARSELRNCHYIDNTTTCIPSHNPRSNNDNICKNILISAFIITVLIIYIFIII